MADQRDPWNTDYSADCSVEDEDVEHLTVSLALESERTWFLDSSRRLSPLQTTAAVLWPAGRFIVTTRQGTLERWEFPQFGRLQLRQQDRVVRIVAPILDRSRCGLSVWPNAPWTQRTRRFALQVSRAFLPRLEDCSWIEPYPEGAKAVICLTDHADFDSPTKGRLLADHLIRRGVWITKSVFPAADRPSTTPWPETGLDDAEYRYSIDRLSEHGSEIAAHGFTPKRDAPPLAECRRRLDALRRYDLTTWIDHGTGDYLLSRGGRLSRDLDLPTLLEESGVQNFWSYFDVWDNPFGKGFSLFEERRGLDVLPDLVDRNHAWTETAPREAAWFALHAFRNLVGDGNDIAIRRRPWSRAGWRRAARWYRVARQVRRDPFGIYGRDGAVFQQSLDSSWVFDTVLLNHLALQLSPKMVDGLIDSAGLLVGHCYMSCELDYARRNVFRRTNGRVRVDPAFETALDHIADRQCSAELSTVSFSQLRRCLSLFVRARLRRTETGWRVEVSNEASVYEPRPHPARSESELTFALSRGFLIEREDVTVN